MVAPFEKVITGSGHPFTSRGDPMLLDEKQMTYYYGVLSSLEGNYVAAMCAFTAAVFGGVHAIAWKFHFPTETERYIWITCALLITGLPFLLFALFLCIKYRIGIRILYWGPLAYFWRIPPVVYIAARAILLVHMFVLLRSSRDKLFYTVSWSNYIPHI
jgi:hypothetical protein